MYTRHLSPGGEEARDIYRKLLPKNWELYSMHLNDGLHCEDATCSVYLPVERETRGGRGMAHIFESTFAAGPVQHGISRNLESADEMTAVQ